MPWSRVVHDFIVKKLLDSPSFHRFVKVTNARLNGQPPPPREKVPPSPPSALTIRIRKVRVFGRLFAQEFWDVLRGKK